jgi:Bacterial PH domain
MPAGSERPPLPPLPRTWRPLGPRIVGVTVVLVLFAVCVASWYSFDEEIRAKFTDFQRGTLIAVGVAILVLMYALLRSRAVASADHLLVVNGYRSRQFEWAQIVSVNFPLGAPWVTLDLADGNVVSVMGIQASDGDRAKRAVRELRALVGASSGAGN